MPKISEITQANVDLIVPCSVEGFVQQKRVAHMFEHHFKHGGRHAVKHGFLVVQNCDGFTVRLVHNHSWVLFELGDGCRFFAENIFGDFVSSGKTIKKIKQSLIYPF